MTLALIRAAVLLALVVLAAGGWLTALRLYEEGAARALSRAASPFAWKSLPALLGAWGRESALLFLATLAHLASFLPRGRLRPGSWLATPEEVRHGLPVLVVPGLLGGRLSMELFRRRLEASTRPALVIDLPAREGLEAAERAVEEGVNELGRACSVEKVDIVAFGVGGIAARRFACASGINRVERCVVLGAGPTRLAAFAPKALAPDLVPGSKVAAAFSEPPPSGTWIVAVRGADDPTVLPPGGDVIPRPAVDLVLPGHGHFVLLGSEKAWRAVATALRRPSEVAAAEAEESTEEAALKALEQLSR